MLDSANIFQCLLLIMISVWKFNTWVIQIYHFFPAQFIKNTVKITYILFGLSGEGADTITKNGGCVIVDINTMKHLIFQQQLKTGKASTSDSAIIRISKIRIFYAESFTSYPKHWLCSRCFAYYLFTFLVCLSQSQIFATC